MPIPYGKKRINVEVSFDVPEDATNQEITMILADAIGEFRSHRLPAKEYVDRRYPDTPGYAWLDRAKKVESTERRCHIADCMSYTVNGWNIEEVGRG